MKPLAALINEALKQQPSKPSSAPPSEAETFVKRFYSNAKISDVTSTPGFYDLFFMVELEPGVFGPKANSPQEAWIKASNELK